MKNNKFKKILISGGAGFIGSRIANELSSLKYEVVVVDDLSTGERKNLSKEIKFYLADISHLKKISEIFEKEKPDVVINEAAKVYWDDSEKDPGLDISTGIGGTVNLLKCCVEQCVKKFIFASSISVYGYPFGKICLSENTAVYHENIPLSIFSYAVTKHTAEQYVEFFNKKFGINYSILRYGHVYGPGQIKQRDVISIFIKNLLDDVVLRIFGNGEEARDYIFIDDAVDATIAAMFSAIGGTYNIGGGKPVSTNDLVEILGEELGNIKTENIKIKEKNSEGAYLDISKAGTELNWTPKIDIKMGLKETIDYYKKISIT